MMRPYKIVFMLGLLISFVGFGLRSSNAPATPVGSQNPPAASAGNPVAVLHAESNLVLVDVIATDKKGNYISDLQKQDFHVYEDGKEQTITAFSHEAAVEPGAPRQQRYIVLFFDDSTMSPGLQVQARQAAAKFVESTASPERQMAIVDFGGTLRVAQNFTADGDLLKKAVSSPEYSSVSPASGGGGAQLASLGAPSLGSAESDFAARSALLSMRDLAKTLHTVPGRKTLILFSAGFPLTPERMAELTATIDALNKSNIAVYPVDVRGLVATMPGLNISSPSAPGAGTGFPPRSLLLPAESPFAHFPGLVAGLAAPPIPDPQKGGGSSSSGSTGSGSSGSSSSGSGSHGSGSSGSTGATGTSGASGRGSTSSGSGAGRSGGGTTNNRALNYNTTCTSSQMMQTSTGCGYRPIIPTIPNDVSTNQQVLYALAKGTGGFEIFNTNDFLQGLNKIAKEMNEYYNLGYIPPEQIHDGNYHKISVKVARSDVTLRYRTGYFDTKGNDLLKGTPEGTALEARVSGQQVGDIPVTFTTPYFYEEPGIARVNLALSVPGSAIDFDKLKGAFHSEVKVLGVAYRPNGSIAARFSDTVKLDYQKKELKDFAKGSFDYQNTFNIAPGSYTLKVALSTGGEKFGKYEAPLVVEPFTGNDLAVEGPAFGEKVVPMSELAANMDSALLEDRPPLVFKGMELVPSTTDRFAKGTDVIAYVEVFDPQLKDNSGRLSVGVLFNIIDQKTNQSVTSSNTILINDFMQPGSPLVPFALKLPTEQLQAGNYRFEIKARDGFGSVSGVRTADFVVQ